MEIVVTWLVLSVLVAVIASNRGHSGAAYFFISLFLSPLIGLILALAIQPNPKDIVEKKIQHGELKKCPYCAEAIQPEAVVCRYCGRDLPKQSDAGIASTLSGQFVGAEKELYRSGPVVLTNRQVRVKSDAYPLHLITNMDVVYTGTSWCVVVTLMGGTDRQFGFSTEERHPRLLMARIQSAREALLGSTSTVAPSDAPKIPESPTAAGAASASNVVAPSATGASGQDTPSDVTPAQ